MGAETGARTSALLASLRCSSTAPRAPSRQRAREPPEAAKERSLAALLAELLLHWRARRQRTFATEAVQANDFCHFPGDVTNGTARAADVPGCAPVLAGQGTGSTSLALRASLTACGPERDVSDIAEPIRSPRRRVAAGRRRSRCASAQVSGGEVVDLRESAPSSDRHVEGVHSCQTREE